MDVKQPWSMESVYEEAFSSEELVVRVETVKLKKSSIE
jgi:hypothetical protein